MTMSSEARERRNAYEREWRKKNPEKVKAIQERHWEKKVKEMKAAEEQKQKEGGNNG